MQMQMYNVHLLTIIFQCINNCCQLTENQSRLQNLILILEKLRKDDAQLEKIINVPNVSVKSA